MHRLIYALLLSAVVIALDRITKLWASHHLAAQSKSLLVWLDLRLAHNTGAAFNFLAHAGGWQRIAFIVLALCVSAWIVRWLIYLPAGEKLKTVALSLILGGALGNAWDRIRYGYVIDFIDAHLKTWHWPTFNLADSAICVGVALFLYSSYRDNKNENITRQS